MKYNFDKAVERRNTKSVKWDLGEKDILPMWVADMDFEVLPEIVEAVKRRAGHAVYGYTVPGDEYYEAIINWWKRRYNFQLKKEWISYSPGVVPALNMLISAFTKPGDKVIIQTPVYFPFFSAIKNNGCEVVENELKLIDGKYYMDFEDLEAKLKTSDIKVMILCSPHNPVGRVWSKEELERLGELCMKNNVLVIADEIHCDLVYKDYVHTTFPSIKDEFAQNCVLCVAPSKTFNIAGLQTSSVITPNESLRKKFEEELASNGVEGPNIFGIEALEAAYNYGDQWLDELMDYLKGNLDYLTSYIAENLPGFRVTKPEGTYLVWMDCGSLGMSPGELKEFFLKKAKVWFNEGHMFGSIGENYVRINIACPRSTLEEGLRRIGKAVKEL